MTPRINETESENELPKLFTQALIDQKDLLRSPPYLLNGDLPPSDLVHPLILKAKLGLEIPSYSSRIYDWNIYSYPTLEEALTKAGSRIPVLSGLPYDCGQALVEKTEAFILPCGELGAALLSTETFTPTESSSNEGLILAWVNYALGPELWEATGKWPRFHSQLHDLFKKHQLLKGDDVMGYYPLIPEARKLEDFGFVGKAQEGYYALTLPWTFPLSGLRVLERVINQEF